MSSISRWSYTSTITVWPPASFDAYGQPTFGTPFTILGNWEEGGDTQTDQNGSEFVPTGTYYFEASTSSDAPEREGYIKRGDHTAIADPLTAKAEKVKKVGAWDMTPFGSTEIPDWVAYT